MALTPAAQAVLRDLHRGCQAATVADLPSLACFSRPKQAQVLAQLYQRGLLTYETIATQIGLTLQGRVLLKLDRSVLPVTPDELIVLKACRGGRLSPVQLPAKLPLYSRQPLIAQLAQAGLIQVYKTDLAQIQLTAQGRQQVTALAPQAMP